MRQPKWTKEQMDEHNWWRLQEDNLRREDPADREEFLFCAEYYANTPEALAAQRADEEIRRQRVEIIDAQCQQAAAMIVSHGDDAIIQTLDDTKQHPWLKFYIVASHTYSRRVIEHVLSDPERLHVWPLLWNPKLRIADLQRVAHDEGCSPFLRGEAESLLADRLDDQPLTA